MNETPKDTSSAPAEEPGHLLLKEKAKRKDPKGAMARRLVYYCVGVLTAAGVWAAVLKTLDHTAELSDVLTFVGAAFGGELLMLLLKRVFAKPTETQQEEEEPWNS